MRVADLDADSPLAVSAGAHDLELHVRRDDDASRSVQTLAVRRSSRDSTKDSGHRRREPATAKACGQMGRGRGTELEGELGYREDGGPMLAQESLRTAPRARGRAASASAPSGGRASDRCRPCASALNAALPSSGRKSRSGRACALAARPLDLPGRPRGACERPISERPHARMHTAT